jgi:hypothetical protein
MSTQEHEVRQLGSFPMWLLFRFLGPCIWLPIAIDIGFRFLTIVYLFLIIAIPWSDYARAYGHADEDGIIFRRFFRKHRITWDDVARVDWSNSNLFQQPYVFLTLEHPVGGFRTVKFACYRKSSRPVQVQDLDWVPEILPWMMNQMRMNQPPRNQP